jgi:hypothetical protein
MRIYVHAFKFMHRVIKRVTTHIPFRDATCSPWPDEITSAVPFSTIEVHSTDPGCCTITALSTSLVEKTKHRDSFLLREPLAGDKIPKLGDTVSTVHVKFEQGEGDTFPASSPVTALCHEN